MVCGDHGDLNGQWKRWKVDPLVRAKLLKEGLTWVGPRSTHLARNKCFTGRK
jgi:hypothetical protein